MQDFRKLKVWQKSHELTLSVYGATAGFPKDEAYGLTSQIRRSCASIPANIAEGCGRGGSAEFARFLHIAMGSASELENHILQAHDLNYLSEPSYQQLSSELTQIKRMLTSLAQRVKTENR